MTHGLSDRSIAEWREFAESVDGTADDPLDRELLNQFLIGVHNRGEELAAHQLKTLVDELDLEPELARELIAFVGPALALLEAYDRELAPADNEFGQVVDDDFDVGPGVLVL